jgi:hypothetical protein
MRFCERDRRERPENDRETPKRIERDRGARCVRERRESEEIIVICIVIPFCQKVKVTNSGERRKNQFSKNDSLIKF